MLKSDWLNDQTLYISHYCSVAGGCLQNGNIFSFFKSFVVWMQMDIQIPEKTKAPSTRIWIFFNLQLFLSDSKISRPHVAKISGFAAEFSGCVSMEAISGKKTLRIQKYPNTCGRGLKEEHLQFLDFKI